MLQRALSFALPLALVLAGCGGDGHDHAHGDHDHDHGGGHVHTAPHGGTLVVLGEEAAHVEFVLDAAEGSLVAYMLDGEAEKSVRLEASAVTLSVAPAGGEGFDVVLEGVANELTGETKGDTSEFRGQHAKLVGMAEFEGKLEAISVRGVQFESVGFPYPEGNE